MTPNERRDQPHVDDLLGAFVLDALDEEEFEVEAHLQHCSQCREATTVLQLAAAGLGQPLRTLQPAPMLQVRLMGSIPDAAPTRARFFRPSSWMPVAKLALPIAASVMLALFGVAIFMNLNVSNRVDDLEQTNLNLTDDVGTLGRENSTLTVQLAQSDEEGVAVSDKLRQLELTSYWLANQAENSFSLWSPKGRDESKGVILVTGDGSNAILLVADMTSPSTPTAYQVWLLRPGDRVWLGEVSVNDRGWGSAAMRADESVFGFNRVELTSATVGGATPSPSDMVLEGVIPVLESSKR